MSTSVAFEIMPIIYLKWLLKRFHSLCKSNATSMQIPYCYHNLSRNLTRIPISSAVFVLAYLILLASIWRLPFLKKIKNKMPDNIANNIRASPRVNSLICYGKFCMLHADANKKIRRLKKNAWQYAGCIKQRYILCFEFFKCSEHL